MKCSSLLKPNKITYTHQGQSKQSLEPKAKMSSRHSYTPIQEKSSINDQAFVSHPSNKHLPIHIHSNKQNMPKNIEPKQTKKDLSRPNPNHNSNKHLDIALIDKIPKSSKLSRNMSMHISSSEILDQPTTHNLKLNNSSISNYAKQILPFNSKKRKLSKPLIQNPSLLNVNHHRHSSVILSRSPLSDKNVLIKDFKDKKQDKASFSKNYDKNQDKKHDKNLQKHFDKNNAKNIDKRDDNQNYRNYDSCKSVQSSRTIEQSKSLRVIGQKKISTTQLNVNSNKPPIGILKKSRQPKQSRYDEDVHCMHIPVAKTQTKPKSILVLKENKSHESGRKIKRSKLSWLIIFNYVYNQLSQGSKQSSLYNVVQMLKPFEKKHHPLEQVISGSGYLQQCEEQTNLGQVLLFVKLTLINHPHVISSTVFFKPQSKQIDPEKTHLTFNNFGQIFFSQSSILHYLQLSQNNKIYSKTQLKGDQSISQTPLHKNPHNVSTKEDEEIVQTARFQQNHHAYHHSRQSSDGINQKGKKKTIFMDHNHQQIYSEAIDLISAKLHKPSHNIKRPTQHQILCPSPVDKSFVSRKSSSTSTNREPKSNGTTNKQISHCSIEDISEILQSHEGEKPLVTSFNKKFYPSSVIHQSSSFGDSFQEDSLMENDQSYKNSNGMQDIYLSKGMESGHLESCRIQALNMNSSLLFLESVILNNLYHTNFNVSFSEEPLDNDESMMRSIESKSNFNKLEDVIQQVQNILKSMKNMFSLDCESMNQQDRQFLAKNIAKESIKIQDLTEMEDFLSLFIDYKVFRKQSKSSLGSFQVSDKIEYFNTVKLSESNLTSFQTRKAAQKVIKSNLIAKYFSFMEGIRINQGPLLLQNIDKLLLNGDKTAKIRILNLSNNDLVSMDGLMTVVEANMCWLEFLNLSNNKIESIEIFFRVLDSGKEGEGCRGSSYQKSYLELRQLHVKNNRISVINYNPGSLSVTYLSNNKKTSLSQSVHFPNLELLDLRSNKICYQQKKSIEHMILQSPKLSIMSLKLNPILTAKTVERLELQKLMNKRSIYEYDSLQMMSAYIKYKDITFSDAGENCCSLIENQDSQTHKMTDFLQSNNSQQLIGFQHKSSRQDSKQSLRQHNPAQKGSRQQEGPNRRKFRSVKNIQLQENSY